MLVIFLFFRFSSRPHLAPGTVVSRSLGRIRHVRTEDPIPDDEERLREVVLGSVKLVMDVVVGGVVLKDDVQRIARDPKPAVVVDRLDRREGEGEEDGGSRAHAGDEEGERAPPRASRRRPSTGWL